MLAFPRVNIIWVYILIPFRNVSLFIYSSWSW